MNRSNEIPIDHAKLAKAQHALAGLNLPDDGESSTFETPDGAVTINRKTFSMNVKTDIYIGGEELPDAAGSAGGTPILTPRRSIEPKRGCLGVMAVLTLIGTGVLIYRFFG